jgi:hypothetical protein
MGIGVLEEYLSGFEAREATLKKMGDEIILG